MAQITTPLDAPAHTRLFAEFANALDLADIDAKMWTPGFAVKHHTLGECLIDALATEDSHTTMHHLMHAPVSRITTDILVDVLGGEDGILVLRALLLALAADLHHADADVRLHAMAAVASLSRAHADYHAGSGNEQDAADDEEFRNDYSDAQRLAQKDAADDREYALSFDSLRQRLNARVPA
jgi:hypothetical protein